MRILCFTSHDYLYSSNELLSSVATITGFEINDPDLGLNIIRADVIVSLTSFSYITLNTKYIHEVDFNTQLYCFSAPTWHCIGDGFNDYQMTFVGTPDSIERVLNGMQFLV